MTIRELRSEQKSRVEFSKRTGSSLVEYLEEMWSYFEELYVNGTITYFSNDFLAFANGYQINTQDYDNLHIAQTLDLHAISATKKATREMMASYLNI